MFVVACSYAIEGLDQAIFSTGRRASKKLLDLIYQFLCKLPGMKEAIIRKNVETIHIQGPGGPDDVRKISSYPRFAGHSFGTHGGYSNTWIQQGKPNIVSPSSDPPRFFFLSVLDVHVRVRISKRTNLSIESCPLPLSPSFGTRRPLLYATTVTDWIQLPIPKITLDGCSSIPCIGDQLRRERWGDEYRHRFDIVFGWVMDHVPVVGNMDAGEFIIDGESKLPHPTNVSSSESRVIGTSIGICRPNRFL
jgi:hypothetical protein